MIANVDTIVTFLKRKRQTTFTMDKQHSLYLIITKKQEIIYFLWSEKIKLIIVSFSSIEDRISILQSILDARSFTI